MSQPAWFRYAQQYPYLCSGIVALLGFALTVLISMVLLLNGLFAEAKHDHQLASEGLARSNQEIAQSLQFMQSHGMHDCSKLNLQLMRQHLLTRLHIRALGFLNERGQLACLSSEGIFTPPRSLPAADFQLGAYQSWHNFKVYTHPHAPLLLMNMVSNGHFVALLDRQLSEQILQLHHVDAIWLDHPSQTAGQAQIIWSAPRLQDQLLPPLLPELRQSEQGSFWWRVDWPMQRFVLGSNVPQTGYFVQSYLEWRSLLLKHRTLLALVLVLAAGLALLLASFVKIKLDKANLLPNRIAQLCHAENVICMYQPIVDLRTQKIIGCEVLMRLQDGENVLFPDQVIPLIREANLAWQLDAAVARKAVYELQQHLPTHAVQPFKVALNFFPENIRYPRLAPLLNELHDERFLLNVEVTEYGMSDELFADVEALRRDGYVISVDDFGTGYSNLGTVKRLSPDYLKIDRSFVWDMEDASLRSSLIPEIIAIADAVGAQLIAEGIENASQAERLKQLGVQFGQGYYFGRPQPLAEFIQLLQKSSLHESSARLSMAYE
ncbi:EAL domain-containing protein [Chitinibacter sp. SCUT-21]|uniref:EAL domain-containing protein n=1 Tax=Chitinibacter sp. SCUT-21 TaxID=2970891 RepID=UPI0035A5F057